MSEDATDSNQNTAFNRFVRFGTTLLAILIGFNGIVALLTSIEEILYYITGKPVQLEGFLIGGPSAPYLLDCWGCYPPQPTTVDIIILIVPSIIALFIGAYGFRNVISFILTKVSSYQISRV